MEEPKESILDAIDFKGLLGFVPGEDDELWEEMEESRREREARGGGIGWDDERSAETDGYPEQRD
ncbi:hypothetical protein [Nocardiopsis eucommiae]|uniref:hypothetical protein n=1 Tax=Nocardiopsis eucommiae TaxID=2831970 RepID=UPI003D73AAF8